MINLFGKNEVIFRSQLSETEVINKLTNKIDVKKESTFGKRPSNYSNPFVGTLKDNKFEIQKSFIGRGALIPIIKGEISKEYDGTIIRTTISPQNPWLLLIWFLGMILGFFLNLYVYINNNHDKMFLLSGIICLPLAVGLYLAQLYFIKQSTDSLKEILKAEIEIYE